MNIRNFYGKLGKNYAWEVELLYKYRDFKEGIDTFIFDMHYDYYAGDHNPQFEISLKILNLIIFDISIYNIWHEDHPNSPYYDIEDKCRKSSEKLKKKKYSPIE